MDANDLKRSFLTAMMGFHYREYLRYCRLLRPGEKPMDKAECHGIAQNIGRKVSHRARQKKDEHKCLNCGEVGPHFVPPSMGEEGFYFCEKEVHKIAESIGRNVPHKEVGMIDKGNPLAERTRCLKAVDDEPEHIKGSWKPLVAEAKANIRKRIEEGL